MEYESTTDIETKFTAVCRAHHIVNDLYWLVDWYRAKVFAIRKGLLKEKIAIQSLARNICNERNTSI